MWRKRRGAFLNISVIAGCCGICLVPLAKGFQCITPDSDCLLWCSARLRIAVKTRDEYSDVQTLPSALLAREGPVGPTRPGAAAGPKMITSAAGGKSNPILPSRSVLFANTGFPTSQSTLNESSSKTGPRQARHPLQHHHHPPLLPPLPLRPSGTKNPSTPALNPRSPLH